MEYVAGRRQAGLKGQAGEPPLSAVSEGAAPLVVLHRLKRWLGQTETWLYQQVIRLPDSIESHVACDLLENIDQFPYPRVYARTDLSLWQRVIDRGARATRFHSLRHLALVAARSGARVLHSHFGNEAWRSSTIARGLGLPHVVTFYGYDLSRLPRAALWRARYRDLFRDMDLALCEGPYMRERLIDLGCPPERARVHHLGVDLKGLKFQPRETNASRRLEVLIAGAFREKKGIPDALLALGLLARRRSELDLAVTVIGGAGSAPSQRDEAAKIQQALRDSGLGARVRLLGYQPYSTMLEAARRADVFLSPSVVARDGDSEGGAPVSIIEMAALGVPVVSTEHCDIPNVLTGRARQFLAPEHDIEALTSRLERLLDARQDWPALTAETRRDIEQRFDSRIQAERLALHYAELAGLPRRQGLLLSASHLWRRWRG
jgi:colanic acid/amylovoran biosynthesis glycosyltransferase